MQPILDTALLMERKRRALARGPGDADFLMRRAADDLAERLAVVERHFSRAAAVHCLTPHAAAVLERSGKVDAVMRIEADSAFLEAGKGLVATPETVPIGPETLDLAVSLLTLHEANDIPGLLLQIRRALKPDGLFLGAMAGAGTLAELRSCLLAAEIELTGGASPRVMPFADIRDVGGLLQRAGLALPVTDVDQVTVRYPDLFGLLRDLRAMGATSALLDRPRRPTDRALFLRAAELYARDHADPDGRIRATFSIIWMSGWAPAASQQKPLKPGSAKASLADALRRPEPEA